MKKYFFYISLLLLLFSCNNDDNIIELHPNLGTYKLVSLTSNIAMDLNFDTVASKDFKSELDIYFLGRRKPRHALELVESTTANEAFFYLGIPRDGYHPWQTYIEQRFGVGDYSKSLIFINEMPEIRHTFSNISFPRDSAWIVNDRNPYPYEVVFNNDQKTTIKVVQKFYDITDENWVITNLVGVFEKK
jgi:hypothetical protein